MQSNSSNRSRVARQKKFMTRRGSARSPQGTSPPRTNTRFVKIGSYDIVGAPDEMKLSLRYSDLYTLGGSANPSPQVWRLNSLFDPDLTGTGHQPTYFDQWSALYNQYLVTGVNIKFAISSDASVPVMFSFAASDVNNSSIGTDANSEMKFSLRKFLGPLTGNGITQCSRKLSMPALTGESVSQMLGDSTAYTSIGTNPADTIFGWMRVASFDGTTTIAVAILVTIDFNVIFRSLTAPGTS